MSRTSEVDGRLLHTPQQFVSMYFTQMTFNDNLLPASEFAKTVHVLVRKGFAPGTIVSIVEERSPFA